MSSEMALEGRGLSKTFGGVPVVDRVDISVRAGEIRAVIGENGAGKSTLMHMLTGVVRPDSGEIRVRGTTCSLAGPRHAGHAGIAMVHQELHLAPMLSVADNLMLVRPPDTNGMWRGSKREADYVRAIVQRVGLNVNPHTPVRTLSAAQCQLLEIAKALALHASVIIFDEPTSALQPAEAERLLAQIEKLRTEGVAILYVSHALEDVLRIASTISVLRDGRLVADLLRDEVDRSFLIRAMVDRMVDSRAAAPAPRREEVILRANDVATAYIRDLNFELRAGEILGFAGLMGAGMHEAARALCGDHAITTGALVVGGHERQFGSPRDALRAGIAVVPEERKSDGVVPGLSVCDNLNVGRYWHHARMGLIAPARLRETAGDLIRRFNIRLTSIDQPISTLSGGNQQKVLIARCMQTDPRILIVASPTRGVDIGAREAIHETILELAARGTAIILISAELDELLRLAHRIAVFSERRMAGILARSEATPVRIMELALAGAHSVRGQRNVA